ncbi:MAG: hypothetical protein QI223_05760 [Candidatus Korarchaeota archaeon]|nr:hypothetical protein [Candidatus Korarchaeota archaeon]
MGAAQAQDLDDLRRRVEDLRAKLLSIRDERRAIIEDLKGLREKRRELIEQVRSKRAKIRELIEERKKIREEVEKLFEERRKVIEEYRKAKKEATEIKNRYESLMAEVGVPERVLRRRIAALERRIETQPLSRDAERDLVVRISHLEAQLQTLMEAKKLKRRYIEIMAEAERWRFFIRDTGEKIKELKAKISEINGEISELIRELDEIRPQIDELSKEIEEKSGKVDEMKARMDELFQQITQTREFLKKAYEDMQAAARLTEEQIKTRLAQEALEKYKAGEKLTLEELRALMEAGLLEGSPASSS